MTSQLNLLEKLLIKAYLQRCHLFLREALLDDSPSGLVHMLCLVTFI